MKKITTGLLSLAALLLLTLGISSGKSMLAGCCDGSSCCNGSSCCRKK
jgi:hypothetical protein